MRLAVRACILIAIAGAFGAVTSAQEGHPLAGTWYGVYEEGTEKHDLTIVLHWDGRNITGRVNPGPNVGDVGSAALNITPGKPAPQGQDSTTGVPPVFRATIEVDMPNQAGRTDRIVFEGTIENPVAGNRRIVGTWTRGGVRGAFRIQRL